MRPTVQPPAPVFVPAARRFAAATVVALFATLVACSKPADPVQPKSAAVPIAPPTAGMPETVVATFVSGDVEAGRSSSWDPVAIGATLEKDKSVKTGIQSECELQFGKTAVIQIQENTVVELKTLSKVNDKSRIAIALDAGSVLCKVRKLTGGESFRVQTELAVGGVRGTEFIVSVASDKTTVIAVKEGAVAVLPASPEVAAAEQAADGGVAAVSDLLDKVQAAAPVVANGQQISYTRQAEEKSSPALAGIGDVVQRILVAAQSGQQVAAGTLQQGDQVVAKAEAALSTAAAAPGGISAQNVQLMKPLDKMQIREDPRAPVPTQKIQAPPVSPPPLQPIEARFAASTRPLIGAVLSGQNAVAADSAGLLVAVTRRGKVLWTVKTENRPNENSVPVVADGKVYFSGAKEFIIASLSAGTVVSRTNLDSASAHLFGQHVLVSPPLGLYPTTAAVRLFNPATGGAMRDVPCPAAR